MCDSQSSGFLCEHDNNGICIGPNCGNFVVDSADGETCDPPNLGINPTTGQIICRLDCTSCGDGVTQMNDSETCDDENLISGCNPARPQQALDACQNDCTPPICSDPSRIAFGGGLDRFDFHGRLTDLVDGRAVDGTEMFVVQLTAPDGSVVYRASLLPGTLEARTGNSFVYRNNGARAGGGIARLSLQHVRGAYRAKLTAYGDLSAAQSTMKNEVFIGLQEWTIAGVWQPIQNGWKLTAKGTVGR